MPFILCRHTIPHDSNVPANAVTNSYAFTETGGASRTDVASAVATELDSFYATIANSFSSNYSLNDSYYEFWDLLDDQPRVPYSLIQATVAGENTTRNDLPAEVAVCMSFQGVRESGANMARRRGRVYLGPFQLVSGDLVMAPTAIFQGILTAFAAAMTNAQYTHCVYSRYTHHAVPVGRNINERDGQGDLVFPENAEALPSSFTPVSSYWCDDAWDIQRRRGLPATVRLTP